MEPGYFFITKITTTMIAMRRRTPRAIKIGLLAPAAGTCGISPGIPGIPCGACGACGKLSVLQMAPTLGADSSFHWCA